MSDSYQRESLELQRAVLAELVAIRRLLEQQGTSRLSRQEVAMMASLMPALVAVFSDGPFLASEVRAHALLRGYARDLSVRQIGRLFRRTVAVAIDGHRLEAIGKEGGSTLWRIVAAG